MNDTKPWVTQALENLGDIHAAREAVYGDDYLHAGEVLLGLFPNGLTVTTAEEFNRLSLFVHLATKLGRYARSINKEGHVDSLDDLSVYAQLLQNHDRLAKERKSYDPDIRTQERRRSVGHD